MGAAGALAVETACGGGKKGADASTTSATPPAPTPTPVPTDFQQRASAPGVLRAYDITDLGTKATGNPYPNVGWYPGSVANPTLDSSHGISAVRFDVLGKSDSNAGGEWFINFSPDFKTQFGAGDEFFMQWRQQFNPAMLSAYITSGSWDSTHTVWTPNNNPTAIKQVICSSQDQVKADGTQTHFDSCTELEIVVTSYLQHRMPWVYQACGWANPVIDQNPLDHNDFRLQNAMPEPYCTMYGVRAVAGTDNTTAVSPACFNYVADEWMTFQLGVKLGPIDTVKNSFVGSRIRLWGAREGKASQLLVDLPWDIRSSTNGQLYGKAWFGPYMTSKDPGLDHALMQTWVAEFIVSRQPIADPGVGTIPPQGDGTAGTPTSKASPLSTLASGRVRDLNAPWYTAGSSVELGRSDYSTIIYEAGGRQMLFFGGGHGAGVLTDIRAFAMDTMTWSSVYPTTPIGDMVAANEDDAHGRWISTNQPYAQHTFNAVLTMGRRYYKLTQSTANVINGMAYYDLDAKRWTWLNTIPRWYYASATCLDPQSGKVVIFGTDTGASNILQCIVYDPVADAQEVIASSIEGAGYMFDLAYDAARDRFMATTYTGEIWEIAFNRTDHRSSAITHIVPGGVPLPRGTGIETLGFAYDGKELRGSVQAGLFYSYDATARTWASRQMLNEDGSSFAGSQVFYCLDFDPSSGCYIFLASGGNTYAFRP